MSDNKASIVERLDAAERRAASRLPSDDALDPERRRRVLATRPELVDQPSVVAANLAANAAALDGLADRLVRTAPSRVVLTGAGDSLAVMQAARSALESMTGLPCEPIQSLELALYGGQILGPHVAVVALSSSGETTRTVQAMLTAQEAGATTVGITNSPESSLAELASALLTVQATRVGWPTQSSTAPLALLLRLAALIGRRRGEDGAADLLAQLDDVPGMLADTISVADPVIASQAAVEAQGRMFLFAGAGPNFGSAAVGAAKVRECTPDHALAVQLEEFHHYNSVKIGEPVWMLTPPGKAIGRGVDTVHEAHRLGGHVHAVTGPEVTEYDGIATSVLHLPAIDERLSALLYFVPAQLVGVHLALAKFASAEAAGG